MIASPVLAEPITSPAIHSDSSRFGLDRDQLVLEHVPLVKSVASRLAHRLPAQVEVQELVSVGVLGLIDAARRYRPALGVPFDAFARRRIYGAMLDALRDLDWAPRSLRRMRRAFDGAITQLRHELGREPEAAEIARALDVSEAEYSRRLDQMRGIELAVVRHANAARTAEELDAAVDTSEGPQARLERKELRDLLAKAIGKLPERQRQILALYYEQELTLSQIGQVIGVGESRVSQLRTQAISRLRATLGARSRQSSFNAGSDCHVQDSEALSRQRRRVA